LNNYNNLNNNKELGQSLRASFKKKRGGNITVLERITCQILPNSAVILN